MLTLHASCVVVDEAGLLEIRGAGLFETSHEPAAVIRLVVDCSPNDPLRMPDEAWTTLCGVALPRLVHRVGLGSADAVLRQIGRIATPS